MKKMLSLILVVCIILIFGCTTQYIIKTESITLNFVGDSVINKLSVQKDLPKYFTDTVIPFSKIVSNEIEVPLDVSFLELYFDKKTVDVLKKIRNVESYLLNPELKHKDSASFNNYTVIKPPIKLTETQVTELQKILMNENNYQQDKIVKNCTFLPDVGFRCYANDSTFVDILVAFYCDDWLFASGKKQYNKDCSKARKSLVYLAKDIYTNDNYIQKLSDNN